MIDRPTRRLDRNSRSLPTDRTWRPQARRCRRTWSSPVYWPIGRGGNQVHGRWMAKSANGLNYAIASQSPLAAGNPGAPARRSGDGPRRSQVGDYNRGLRRRTPWRCGRLSRERDRPGRLERRRFRCPPAGRAVAGADSYRHHHHCLRSDFRLRAAAFGRHFATVVPTDQRWRERAAVSLANAGACLTGGR
jgi:hypothetical protein